MPKFIIETNIDPLGELWCRWSEKAGRSDADDESLKLSQQFGGNLPLHLAEDWAAFQEENASIQAQQEQRAFAAGLHHGILVGLDLAKVGTPNRDD